MSKFKPILCIDFDGCIHKYSNGWQNGEIYDVMADGFIAFSWQARDEFKLVIYSSRSKTAEGIAAMKAWLGPILAEEQPFSEPVTMADFEFASEKPPAFLTIDDRAICFNGIWSDLDPAELRKFKPWNAK